MKKLFSGFVLIASFTATCALHAQVAPQIEWTKCLGGSSLDEAASIQQTQDGGFIIAGSTLSNDGDVSGNHGSWDHWIVKLDSIGNIEWQKALGGNNDDVAYSIEQTNDGFIIAGSSGTPDNGDVSGNHGDTDYWIVKLDLAGNLTWQNCLGGTAFERAMSIRPTNGDGYIVAGYTSSYDGDISGNHSNDFWVVRLDSLGDLIWQKCLGGTGIEWAFSVKETTDGGFIVAGYSTSNNFDVSGNHGVSDYWIVKLDSAGNLVWQKSLGGSNTENALSVIQTNDGGFVVAGESNSLNGDVSGWHEGYDDYGYGAFDYWIVKLDTGGNLVWQKCLGGTSGDDAQAIQQTTDGGFIIAGVSNSNDGDVSGNHGGLDYWIMKLDTSGNLIWQKCLGGSGNDVAYSIQEISDGRFIIAGTTSSNDDDVSGNHGDFDYWIVKLSTEILSAIPPAPSNSFSLHPNPVQNLLIIDLPTPSANATIQVYDLQGRKMNCESRIANFELNSIELNASSLRDGFYTLQIINNKTGEIEIGKFVKAN